MSLNFKINTMNQVYHQTVVMRAASVAYMRNRNIYQRIRRFRSQEEEDNYRHIPELLLQALEEEYIFESDPGFLVLNERRWRYNRMSAAEINEENPQYYFNFSNPNQSAEAA